jgi:hypothetical protein
VAHEQQMMQKTILIGLEFGLATLNLAASNLLGLLMVWAGYAASKTL